MYEVRVIHQAGNYEACRKNHRGSRGMRHSTHHYSFWSSMVLHKCHMSSPSSFALLINVKNNNKEN
ncbi:uncharacterized protein LOC143031997 isoform X5 [Oratosquilla oratoria]|uniref:uncharacterized protein LOC143031997 isoform X5 n=1 Tax=Oratosquilla oratoria TaxID=337810 RepID=UPI003F75CD2B